MGCVIPTRLWRREKDDDIDKDHHSTIKNQDAPQSSEAARSKFASPELSLINRGAWLFNSSSEDNFLCNFDLNICTFQAKLDEVHSEKLRYYEFVIHPFRVGTTCWANTPNLKSSVKGRKKWVELIVKSERGGEQKKGAGQTQPNRGHLKVGWWSENETALHWDCFSNQFFGGGTFFFNWQFPHTHLPLKILSNLLDASLK